MAGSFAAPGGPSVPLGAVSQGARRVLVTGATGYVGGRLLTALVNRGERVRCLARDPARLVPRVPPGVEVVGGDVTSRASLEAALAGVDVAYYLVHSMGDASGFEERERAGARNFAHAASASGVRRIVYLGGLGDDARGLSPHLRSRHEVGRILRDSGVPTLELRASIVIGSGSLSFELVRALTEHLPAMITPRWVSVLAQPIGIQDLVACLLEALDVPIEGSVVAEIGGPDRISYLGLMQEYARQRGLRRWMIPVPLLTPKLSSLWLGLVTPVYARVGRKLIESIRHPTIVTTDIAHQLFSVRPIGASAAIRAALENEDREYAETRWSDAASAAGLPRPLAPGPTGLRLTDSRTVSVMASQADCFAIVSALGGRAGWPPYTWLWRLRGAIDLLLGGVGMRRGRPEGRPLRTGDALDFWRVDVCEPAKRLRLAAEMRLPGRAWLEFEIAPTVTGACLRQTATFDPAGLGGLTYWYVLLPVHALIFHGMLRAIARRAEARSGAVLA
ncbi:MAG: SDR family oxidoreductase [Vicinamibacterales bacterium]